VKIESSEFLAQLTIDAELAAEEADFSISLSSALFGSFSLGVFFH
jgi:hypothetical protein